MATGKGNQSVEEVVAACKKIEMNSSIATTSSPVYGTKRSGGKPSTAAGGKKVKGSS